MPGSELGWAGLAGPEPHPTPLDEYRYGVFGDSKWEVRVLDFDHDVARADKAQNETINAVNPDLAEFVAHGGKLILYQKWADQLVAPENAIWYYDAVRYTLGSPEDAVRLFMVPGMAHCRGGDGASEFDALSAVERWVESGAAPDRIVAAKRENGVIVSTRPLCPYPGGGTL